MSVLCLCTYKVTGVSYIFLASGRLPCYCDVVGELQHAISFRLRFDGKPPSYILRSSYVDRVLTGG